MTASIVISADEVNCLIYSYLVDSGFKHTAFTMCNESHLKESQHFEKHIRRGELVELLAKALLYVEVETHWKADELSTKCQTGFSLLQPHICSAEPPPPRPAWSESSVAPLITVETHKLNGSSEPVSSTKRKAGTASPAVETDDHDEKRQRRDADAMEADLSKKAALVKSVSSKPKPKPVTPDQDAMTLLVSHKKEVFNCAWNPIRHQVLATGSKDGVVNVWELPERPSKSVEYPPPKSYTDFAKDDDSDVTALQWSPDGSYLGIGSYDAVLRILSPSGELYYSGERHEGPLFAVRFSPNSRMVLTASLDGLTCVWDVVNRRFQSSWRCHRECVLDVAWIDDNTFFTSGSDGVINIMRIDQQQPLTRFTGHNPKMDVNQVELNHDRTKFATCSDDGTVRIWKLPPAFLPGAEPTASTDPQGRPILCIGHWAAVCGIAWRPNTPAGANEQVGSVSFDKTVRLWDSETGQCVKTYGDHTKPVYTLAFSDDGKYIAAGGGSGWLYIHEVESAKQVWEWHSGSQQPAIFEIAWQQFGGFNRIAVALENNDVGIVDVNQIPGLSEQN